MKPTAPNIDPDTLATLLIYSTRYCLGRASYAPSQVCEILRAYAKQITRADRAIILRDIREYLAHEKSGPCRRYWVALAEEWGEKMP